MTINLVFKSLWILLTILCFIFVVGSLIVNWDTNPAVAIFPLAVWGWGSFKLFVIWLIVKIVAFVVRIVNT